MIPAAEAPTAKLQDFASHITLASDEQLCAVLATLRVAGRASPEIHESIDHLRDRYQNTSDLRLKLEIGRLFGLLGLNEEAMAMFAELKVKYPKNVNAYRLLAEVLVQKQDYASALDVISSAPGTDSEEMIADTVFRAIKLAIYQAAVKAEPRFVAPQPSPAVDGALIVMMIRDEADIILQNLRHHYVVGFRKFVIILNCCRDETEAIVNAFAVENPDVTVICIKDPTEGYYQADKTRAAIRFGSEYFQAIRQKVEWCFILDADEFICIDSGAGIQSLIDKADHASKEVIAFHLCNATSSGNSEFLPSTDIYQHFDLMVGCSMPIVVKNAFRLAIDPVVHMGNHTLFYKGLRFDRSLVAAQEGARMVHLPYRSRSQIRSKIINGGTAYKATDLRESFGSHWRRLYKEYLEKGEATVERQMSTYAAQTSYAATHRQSFRF